MTASGDKPTSFGFWPELRTCFSFGAGLDRAHGRPHLTTAAAYYGLSFDSSTFYLLVKAGAHIGRLRRQLLDVVKRPVPGQLAVPVGAASGAPYRDSAAPPEVTFEPELERLTRRAAKRARETGHREVGGRHFLVALLAEPSLETCAILAASGFDVRAMPSDAAMLARSRALEAEARAARDLPAGDTHVVVHNDEQTPFVLVITILVEVFGLRLRQAMDQTLATHKSGRAVVATLARAEAEEKARVAMKIASLNGSSLQVTTEPHRPPSEA